MTKILEVRTTPLIAPIPRPVKTASGVIDRFPVVLIDVVTDAGVVGRAYSQVYLPELLRALDESVQALGRLVAGRDLAPRDLHEFLLKRLRLWGVKGTLTAAMGGLDMALWDAWAKVRGEPLYAALGAAPRACKAYFSVGMYDANTVHEVAEECVARNFAGLKIKLGLPTIADDLAVVRAARKILGDRALMVDYNQSLSPAEAMARCRALDGEGLTWIEEPVLADDYATCAALTEAIATPIQIGENFHGPDDMRAALAARAMDLVMPDAQFIRGVTGWLEAAALARMAGMGISSHTFVEASTHLLCAAPTADWLEHMDVAGGLLAEPFPQVDGRFMPPDRPGIGMEWDEEKVARYRVE
jgi:mandelate racemase